MRVDEPAHDSSPARFAAAPSPLDVVPEAPAAPADGSTAAEFPWVPWALTALGVFLFGSIAVAAALFVVGRSAYETSPLGMASKAASRSFPGFQVTRLADTDDGPVVTMEYTGVRGLVIVVGASYEGDPPRRVVLDLSSVREPLTDPRGNRLDGFARVWSAAHAGSVITDVSSEPQPQPGDLATRVRYFTEGSETDEYALMLWSRADSSWRLATKSEEASRAAPLPARAAGDLAARTYGGFRVTEIRTFREPGHSADRPCVILESTRVPGFRWAVDPNGASWSPVALTEPPTQEFFGTDKRVVSFMKWWVSVHPGAIVTNIMFERDDSRGAAGFVDYFGRDGHIDVGDTADVETFVYRAPSGPWDLDTSP